MHRVKKELILLFILIIAVRAETIEDICQSLDQRFRIAGSDQEVNFDVTFVAKRSFLGMGSFGTVYRSTIENPSREKGQMESLEVAVKRILYTRVRVQELSLMRAMGNIGIGPRFFGCKYGYYDLQVEKVDANRRKKTVKETKKFVWIVQDLLDGNLNTLSEKAALQNLYLDTKVAMYSNVVRGLYLLNSLGFVHSDLKPENLMIKDGRHRIFTIDYGVAVKMDSRPFKKVGTPYFLNVNKHTGPRYHPRDDLYALALTIAIAESSYDDVFHYSVEEIVNSKGKKVRKYTELDDSCFYETPKDYCWKKIMSNCKEIFESREFGLYDEHQTDWFKWNFTTLLLRMIDQTSDKLYPLSMLDTFHVMDNIIVNMRVFRRVIDHFEKQKERSSDPEQASDQDEPPTQNELLGMVKDYLQYEAAPLDIQRVKEEDLSNIKPSLAGHLVSKKLLQKWANQIIHELDNPPNLLFKHRVDISADTSSDELLKKPKSDILRLGPKQPVQNGEISDLPEIVNPIKPVAKMIAKQPEARKIAIEVADFEPEFPVINLKPAKNPFEDQKPSGLIRRPTNKAAKEEVGAAKRVNELQIPNVIYEESQNPSKDKAAKLKRDFIKENINYAGNKPHQKINQLIYQQKAGPNKKIEEIKKKDPLAKMRGHKAVPVQDQENLVKQVKIDNKVEKLKKQMGNNDTDEENHKRIEKLLEKKQRLNQAPLLDSQIISKNPQFLETIYPEEEDHTDGEEEDILLPSLGNYILAVSKRHDFDFKNVRPNNHEEKMPVLDRVDRVVKNSDFMYEEKDIDQDFIEIVKTDRDGHDYVIKRPLQINQTLNSVQQKGRISELPKIDNQKRNEIIKKIKLEVLKNDHHVSKNDHRVI